VWELIKTVVLLEFTPLWAEVCSFAIHDRNSLLQQSGKWSMAVRLTSLCCFTKVMTHVICFMLSWICNKSAYDRNSAISCCGLLRRWRMSCHTSNFKIRFGEISWFL